MIAFYHAIFYNPLYNGLIFLISFMPAWAGIGVAVILLTALVRLILFPLSRAAIKTQIALKELEPKLAELKQKNKGNQQEISMQTMKLYREYKINPFSGFLLLLIQLPIIIALYSIFRTGGLPHINTDILYSFIHAPAYIKTTFLDVNLTQRSLIFGLIAAVSQFFQVRFSIPEIKVDPNKKGENTFKDDLMRSMNMQMRYVLPIFVFFISYSVNAAVPIYWTTSNLFAIGQEIFVRRKLVDQSNQKLKQSLIIK
jgi:YidC/Oxa1 family membrane protein insertase